MNTKLFNLHQLYKKHQYTTQITQSIHMCPCGYIEWHQPASDRHEPAVDAFQHADAYLLAPYLSAIKLHLAHIYKHPQLLAAARTAYFIDNTPGYKPPTTRQTRKNILETLEYLDAIPKHGSKTP
jgi:hypothetical protein